MPGVRGVACAGRGGGARRPEAERAGRAGVRGAAVARRRHGRRHAAPLDGTRRARPRPRRRPRAGLGGADRRRPGDRQVDARAPGVRRPRLLPERPRDQGRRARRPARARAPGRHRALLRGRLRPRAARAARREEPLRVDQRGGGLRDGGARARRGAEPLGGVPRRAPRRRPGLHRARDPRGQPARPGRDPGAGLALGPGAAAPDGNRARRRAGGASPRGPREAPRHAAPRPGRLPECRRGPARRRAGGGPGRRRGGRLERARPGGRRGRGRVGRGRPHGRGAGRRPRRRAAARGGAAGVPPLRAAGDERPRPRGSRRRRARGGRVARPALARAGAPMTFLVLFWLNVLLLAVFAVILMRPQLLGFSKRATGYITLLSICVITLLDELTSVFYAPAEAHRFIGMTAIFFIAFTSLLMRVLSTRMVEISEILELHGLRGGGVYSFSYFVLGPVASFVAVASILVDYILTACISTVSAA